AYGPLPAVREALGRTGLQRYPEPTALDLREAIATHLGVSADAVVATPGSVALCRLIVETVCDPGDEVVFAWRSFEAYPMLVTTAGAVPVTVPLVDARHDLVAMAAAVTDRTRLVFVCSPNNPTGPVVGAAELTAFLDAIPSDVLVVLDEAYGEFVGLGVDRPDGPALLPAHQNLLLLRTFSKAYGLAGARVGYGVCDPSLASVLRSAQVPFAVAQPSIDVAVASLGCDLGVRVKETAGRRDELVDWLRGKGMRLPDAHGNFVWLPLGEWSVPLAAGLAQRRVLVRPFDGDGVRITIGDDEEMAMLRSGLEALLTPALVG
ncbi:MAG: aminotransferase class I/II-fold pyridoxal phosphate-dependent enzyme, partial [Mycobacteriales bacterium]